MVAENIVASSLSLSKYMSQCYGCISLQIVFMVALGKSFSFSVMQNE